LTSTPARPPGADHDRHRRRQTERARAGDDQHRDRVDQREAHRGRRAEYRPHRKCQPGDGNDGRHEPAGHSVGERLDRRARALRFGDHRDDPSEHGVVADSIRTHDESAGAVDGCAGHVVAWSLLRRYRFPGDHRLVDGAFSFEHDPVDRHLLTRTDPQVVSGQDLFQRDLGLGAVIAYQASARRSEIQQRPDGAAGSRPSAQLEHLAEQHQGDDDRRRLEIDRHFALWRAE
jgi:hypothetical protein